MAIQLNSPHSHRNPHLCEKTRSDSLRTLISVEDTIIKTRVDCVKEGEFQGEHHGIPEDVNSTSSTPSHPQITSSSRKRDFLLWKQYHYF